MCLNGGTQARYTTAGLFYGKNREQINLSGKPDPLDRERFHPTAAVT